MTEKNKNIFFLYDTYLEDYKNSLLMENKKIELCDIISLICCELISILEIIVIISKPTLKFNFLSFIGFVLWFIFSTVGVKNREHRRRINTKEIEYLNQIKTKENGAEIFDFISTDKFLRFLKKSGLIKE